MKIKKLKITVFILMAGFLTLTGVSAKDKETETSVSYIPNDIYKNVELRLEIGEGGTVFDEGQSIHEGVIIYDLKHDEKKHFKFQPDDGYEISIINFDDGYVSKNLVKESKNNIIEVTMKDKNGVLNIQFKKKRKPDIPKIPEKKPDNPIDTDKNESDSTITSENAGNPDTADHTRNSLMLVSMLVTCFIMFLLIKSSNKED